MMQGSAHAKVAGGGTARASCASCGQMCRKTLQCGRCKHVVYCSTECQKRDWQTHKGMCDVRGKSAHAEGPSACKDRVDLCERALQEARVTARELVIRLTGDVKPRDGHGKTLLMDLCMRHMRESMAQWRMLRGRPDADQALHKCWMSKGNVEAQVWRLEFQLLDALTRLDSLEHETAVSSEVNSLADSIVMCVCEAVDEWSDA